MQRKICFSTGNMYQNYKNIYDQIEACLGLDVDGIEILIATAPKLMEFKLTPRLRKRLLRFKYNTIHFPFYSSENRNTKKRLLLYNNNRSRKLLEKVRSIAKQINAVNINIHAYQIKNKDLLKDFSDINFTIENVEPHNHYSLNHYKRILEKNPQINMLLDTSHAVLDKKLEKFVKSFKEPITFIHLSATKNKEKDDHYLIHRFNHPNRKKLEAIKVLKCPVIIEAGREKGLEMKDFKNEIEYVKKWLK